jgi:uncharacterized membrane protein
MRSRRERWRISGLVAALTLFFGRVVGQVQVLLLEPEWLPPMQAWYSGVLPYPILLPAQIVLLMLMSLVAYDHVRGRGFFWPSHRAVRIGLRAFAILYAAAMALRLAVMMSLPPHSLLEAGIIPITFHWVLAGFVWLVSVAPVRRGDSPSFDGSSAVWDHELLERVHVDGRERVLHVSARELVKLRRLLDA